MIKKDGSNFKEAALRIMPSKWIIHHCSMCNYPCGYVFSTDYQFTAYDSGCDCTGRGNVFEVPWDNLADHYNMQKDSTYINEMNKFWGFVA